MPIGDTFMIDLSMITKLLGGALSGAQKVTQHFEKRKEEKRIKTEEELMQAVEDNLRRTTYANAGNFLKPEIGSEDDRLYSKMAAKGRLVRVPFGYMLPEFVQHSSGSLY
jgi:hypothetical protein